MIPESDFLVAVAGLNASLAGLAGLVVGLRRGSELRPMDSFRLRQIVEFSFANVLFAIAFIPLTSLIEAPITAVRLASAVALVYGVLSAALLFRRMRHDLISWTLGWRAGVLLIDTLLVVVGIVAIVTGTIGWYEALLVVLLARPMFAFLLVLGRFGAPD